MLTGPVDFPTTPPLDYDKSRGGGVYGPTICVDPAFAYYKTRPLADIFRDIRLKGFTAVHLVSIGSVSLAEERRFCTAIRNAGLSPVLRVYPPTDFALYAAHPAWRQKMLGGSDGQFSWRVYLCPNEPDFVTAYCNKIVSLLRNANYDGIQITELWFEEWGGPEVSRGVKREHYACVCDACRAKFQAQTGVDPVALFDTTSSYYYRKTANQALYQQWVDFRVQSIQNFGQAICTAVRTAFPDTNINVTYLSDARVEPGAVREYQANDLDRMVTEFNPHILTIEDAWQDWLQPNLPPTFINDYAAYYRDRLKALSPQLFVMSHADIGSDDVSRRSYQWIQDFAKATVDCGFHAMSAYEWSVSSMTAESGKSEEPAPQENQTSAQGDRR